MINLCVRFANVRKGAAAFVVEDCGDLGDVTGKTCYPLVMTNSSPWFFAGPFMVGIFHGYVSLDQRVDHVRSTSSLGFFASLIQLGEESTLI